MPVRETNELQQVRTIARTARAMKYTGNNTDAIRQFIGNEGLVTHRTDGTLYLHAQGIPKRRVWFGWWVSIDDSGFISVHDDRAFQRYWESAE